MTTQHRATGEPSKAPRVAKARSEATDRAYRSDLRAIADFWSDMGAPVPLEELSEGYLFAYLASLVKAGRSTSTLRRRLTALRSYVSDHDHGGLTVDGLHCLEDRILRSAASRTSALVVSDDAIVREGLAAVLARKGVLTWADGTADAHSGIAAVWDYVLVWLPSRRGIDPFSSVNWVAAASATGVPIVALYPNRMTDLSRLRLSEAGARYALPQGWLAARVEELPQMLSSASLPARFHLETPLAIRQRLGLRLAGELAPLLAAASEVDEDVWRAAVHEDAPRLRRGEIQRLRRIAADSAGIPPPIGRYSTAVRNAPTIPDWREVRRVVRQAFNMR